MIEDVEDFTVSGKQFLRFLTVIPCRDEWESHSLLYGPSDSAKCVP